MALNKILVIIPAFNESESIAKTIAEVKAQNVRVDILVIDDGSKDSTARQARAAQAEVVSLPFNLGIGGAVQTGLLYARAYGYDYALQVDGDGQHDPRYVQTILAPVQNGECDIVVGSRFIGPAGAWRSSAVRRIGIRFFAWLISGLTGYTVTDPTSGFRAFGRKAIAVFSRNYPQDFPEPESIVIARKYQLSLKEVPVEMRKRMAGHSSIRYFKTLYYMIKVTFAILLDMLKRPQFNNL